MITDPKIEGYESKELIIDEDLVNEASLAIADLAGDIDHGYKIVIDGVCTSTAHPYITSSLANTWVGQALTWKTLTDPASVDGVSSGRPRLASGIETSSSVHHFYITTHIISRLGKRRWFHSAAMYRYTGGYIGGSLNICEHETDTTTELSLINILLGGNFTGNIKVYRLHPK